jgi:hypothetical protein
VLFRNDGEARAVLPELESFLDLPPVRTPLLLRRKEIHDVAPQGVADGLESLERDVLDLVLDAVEGRIRDDQLAGELVLRALPAKAGEGFGQGFAFVGNQVPLRVGEEEFRIDLLFYHLKLRRYVVIELKAGKFRPEHMGKLNFYLSAVDDLLRHPDDQPSIGLVLCKDREDTVAEYALRGTTQPMAVSQYELMKALPENLKDKLPSVEDLEAELEDTDVEPDP